MNLIYALTSDLRKTPRTGFAYLLVIFVSLTPIVFFTDYYYQDDITDKILRNPWFIYLTDQYQLLGVVIVPLLLIFLCTILSQIEYRNNTWKQVLVIPRSKAGVFLTRYILILLIIVCFLLTHVALSLATAYLVDVLKPEYGFRTSLPDLHLIATYTWRTFISVLAISAIQFWLSLRFRNFMIPIGVGLALWASGLFLTFGLKQTNALLHPFAIPVYAAFEKFQPNIIVILLSSVMLTIIILYVAYRSFRAGRGIVN